MIGKFVCNNFLSPFLIVVLMMDLSPIVLPILDFPKLFNNHNFKDEGLNWYPCL